MIVMNGTPEMLKMLVLKEMKIKYKDMVYGVNATAINLKAYLMGELGKSEAEANDYIETLSQEVAEEIKGDKFFEAYNQYMDKKITFDQLSTIKKKLIEAEEEKESEREEADKLMQEFLEGLIMEGM